MESPALKAGRWPTQVKVQCRNEEPFEAVIKFQPIPQVGLVPYIDCPHCCRGYYLNPKGEWMADRPLVVLE
jgi:hypothetical protein